MKLRKIRCRAVFLVTVLASLFLALPAFAQYPGGGQTPPTVKGEKFFRGGPARTGSDVMLLLLIALALLVLGLTAYYASRRSARRES